MMRLLPTGVLLASAAISFGAPVQQATNPASGETRVVARTQRGDGFLLHVGQEVHLKFARDINPKKVDEGDPVEFVLEENLMVDDVVVAKAGSRAYGEVIGAKRSSMMGKGGELSIRIDYLMASGNKVRLRATSEAKEDTKSTDIIKRNKSIEQGESIVVYVAEEIRLPPTETN